uniref:TSA: Wollemia nobilis Ref_Wollemi_Transcript_4429_1467 transcribed RNA sequence n=1 Tax=Wollemia nobilis TaxID=56998 RepID=A0A0C9RY48_9CONI
MRKRERENPCAICGHYHKFEEGEACGVCGHRMQGANEKSHHMPSAFPTEVLPKFLYLGSYDNASRAELLKAQGIARILNTVPACQNLYKNSFVYHCLKEEQTLPFNEAVDFIEQCRKDNVRVLVHCMSGQSRSPAIVIAYLMRYKGWRLAESYQWVKERRPSINLNSAVVKQLQDYEVEVFGTNALAVPIFTTPNGLASGFGFQTDTQSAVSPPTFCQPPSSPNFIFGATNSCQSSSGSNFNFGVTNSPNQGSFIFGARTQDQQISNTPLGSMTGTPMDNAMDST